MNRKKFAVAAFILFGFSLSPYPSQARSLRHEAIMRQSTVIYRLDRYSVLKCFAKLLSMAETAEVSDELQCSVALNGPFDGDTFQKYLTVDTLEMNSEWEPPDGFYVHATLRADLQNLKINLKANARGKIEERHLVDLRNKFLAKIGTPLRIDYIESDRGR